MSHYKHTQKGYFVIIGALSIALCYTVIYRLLPAGIDTTLSTTLVVLIIFILLSFSSLQTVISENYLSIKFGWGIFQKRFLLDDVLSVKSVKNRWYHGWGIHFWLWPHMWIYNVSGFDAIELLMKNGKIYRIGTDVPRELAEEINKYIK